MSMDELDDIFDGGDLGLDQISEEYVPEVTEYADDGIFLSKEESSSSEGLALNEFLKLKGFEDGKITILGDDNTEEVVNFNELTDQEQFDILASTEDDDDYGLIDNEIDLINHLRTNNLSVEDFLENYKQEIISEFNTSENTNYDIDNYDDQELYLLDLKSKYDLTDEELVKELEKELQDEALFAKKTSKLRIEYKQLEDQYKEQEYIEFEQQREGQYNQFRDNMVDVAIRTPEFHGIILEDAEKNEVLSSILELDDKGVSSFYKSLNSPEKLYEAAWFMRYGKDAFAAIEEAYKTEINRIKKDTKTSVVIKDNKSKQQNSIYDLF